MKPNWCRDMEFFKDVAFVNIEDLDLEFSNLFAGNELPASLKERYFNTHKQSLAQVLSRLTSE